MTSMERPSRRVRESATAMWYWGLRILPSRVSLILTAMMKRSSVVATLQFGDLGRIARIRFCLTCVTDAQAPCGSPGGSRARQPPIVPEQALSVKIATMLCAKPLHLLYVVSRFRYG